MISLFEDSVSLSFSSVFTKFLQDFFDHSSVLKFSISVEWSLWHCYPAIQYMQIVKYGTTLYALSIVVSMIALFEDSVSLSFSSGCSQNFCKISLNIVLSWTFSHFCGMKLLTLLNSLFDLQQIGTLHEVCFVIIKKCRLLAWKLLHWRVCHEFLCIPGKSCWMGNAFQRIQVHHYSIFHSS